MQPGGMLVGAQRDVEMPLWSVGDDAALAALAPLTVPEGEKWNPAHVARGGDAVILTVDRRGTGDALLGVICSSEGSKSWNGPSPFPGDGIELVVNAVHDIDGRFVLVEKHSVKLDWEEEYGSARAAAWSGATVEGLAEETVPLPLPLWGLENFQDSGGRGSLGPETISGCCVVLLTGPGVLGKVRALPATT